MIRQKQNFLIFSLLGLLLPTLAYVFTARAASSDIVIAIALTQTAVAQQPAKGIDPPATPETASSQKNPVEVAQISTNHNELASNFEFGGISLPYQEDLVSHITARKTQAFANYDNFMSRESVIVEELPDFTELILDTGTRPGRLAVQPIKTETDHYYSGYPAVNLEIFEALRRDLHHQTGNITNPIQLKYLPFQSGQGRRHIQVIKVSEPASDQMKLHFYYRFEGLTADGRYQVWFNYPIFTVIGPLQVDNTNPELNKQLIDQMNILTADDFIPNLAKLDAWVQQFQIEPVDSFNYTLASSAVESALSP